MLLYKIIILRFDLVRSYLVRATQSSSLLPNLLFASINQSNEHQKGPTMSSMDVDVDIPSFLREARISAPDSLQGSILQMEDLWERRLWHQLTVELEKFFIDPQSAGSRMRMFKDFVGTFEKNINQLKLVGLALLAKEECKGRPFFKIIILI